MKLLIIRHGDPDYAADSLTEKGWREAELLSKRLEKVNIDAMYVSPLGRARATASLTEEKKGKKAEILPWLHEFKGKIISPYSNEERIAWDTAPGMWCNDARFYDFDKWSETPIIKTGNARAEFDEVGKGLDALLAKHGVIRDGKSFRLEKKADNQTVALFCHFCLGVVLVSHLTGVSPFVMWNNFFLPPTSVTELVTETDATGISHFRCVSMGDISHLYAGGEPMSESGLYPKFEY